MREQIDDHVACAVAGITADANILINFARLAAQRYRYAYGEPIPIEQLLQRICDLKQSYTQYGGLRPFGVSFLVAGWDEHYGFQLYQSDPSGNYGGELVRARAFPFAATHRGAGWKATAIGANNQAAQTLLKDEYKAESELSLRDVEVLAVKVLSKTMDTTKPNPDKSACARESERARALTPLRAVEFAVVTRNAEGEVVYRVLPKPEVQELIKAANLEKDKEPEAAGDM